MKKKENSLSNIERYFEKWKGKNYIEGWIIAREGEREFLESIGITVGPYNYKMHRFENCRMPGRSLQILGKYIGIRFFIGVSIRK